MNQQTASANNQQSSATGHNLGKDGTVQFKAQPPVGKLANDNGLPLQLKSGMEQLSGFSLDDVKVHYNSAEPAQLQAHAFARGTDIHVASGQEKHLAHEAWHVVQQKQGRVKPTTQLKGNAINDDVSLETEADVMGAKAAAVQPFTTQLRAAKTGANTPVIQGKWSRMSTLLSVNDERMVEQIRTYASRNQYVEALRHMLTEFPSLFLDLKAFILWAGDNEEKREILFNAIKETYLEDGRYYTAGEIIGHLESKMPEAYGYDDTLDESLVSVGVTDSYETDESDDHAEGSDADAEILYPEELEVSDFENIPEHTDILLLIFENMLQHHSIDIKKAEIKDHFFKKWKTGVHTRSFWQNVKREVASGKSVDEVAQLARTGNTESYQESYKTKNFGTFKKVGYIRDSQGNINFTKPKRKTTWVNPVKTSTQIALNKGMKDKKYGLTPGGQKVKIGTASRSQHFAIGDRLSPWAKANRKGAWTWHHLSKEYDMVLVDMTVHAKHGHNGGFHIWT